MGPPVEGSYEDGEMHEHRHPKRRKASYVQDPEGAHDEARAMPEVRAALPNGPSQTPPVNLPRAHAEERQVSGLAVGAREESGP